MRITMCGSSSAAPAPGRAKACIVVEDEGHVVMLDCGPGSIQRAFDFGVDLQNIGAVLISHQHADHILDLGQLMKWCSAYGWRQPEIVAPPDAAPVIAASLDLARAFGGTRARASGAIFDFPVSPVSGDDLREVNGYRVQSVDVPHDPTIECAARRLQLGKASVVYSGDIGPGGDNIIPFAAGATVLIHDTYSEAAVRTMASQRPNPERFLNSFPPTHTEVRQVAARAREAGVEELVLTHLLPTENESELLAEARSLFSGEVYVARDGLVLDV
jgi:ribonuclease BN (tRNA processing enzyme)